MENSLKIELPLSWTKSPGENNLNILTSFNSCWISFSEIETIGYFRRELQSLISQNKKIIIRGVKPENMKSLLSDLNFKFYPIGSEALLDTSKDLFEKKSLKELIKRGQRHGRIREKNISNLDWVKYTDLWLNSAHAEEPKLKYLYRLEVDKHCKIFVMSAKDKYLGAVTISKNNPTKYQAELILRRKNAPVGIMEALIYHIKEELFSMGVKSFSLGEVPFVIKEKGIHNFIPLTLNAIGRGLKFAYNYKGLFNFKNKFNPLWKDVYLAAYPSLRPGMMFNIYFNSNLNDLVLYKLLKLGGKLSPHN